MINLSISSRGSIWRKWDLHLHTPNTKLNNQYSSIDGKDVWDFFCEKIEASDVSVFWITDYFSIDNFFTFSEKFRVKYPDSKKIFFPNIEFRTESKNSENEHIQLHVIFSNAQSTLDKVENFLTRLKLVSTDNCNLTNKYCTCADLIEIGYDKAMIEVSVLKEKLEEDFADDEYMVIGVANGYGSLRPNGLNDWRGAEYAKELDKKCKAFFGSSRNVDFFLNKKPGRSIYGLPPKPVLFGCDAHSFHVLDKKLGNAFEQKNEQNKIIDYSEITWIKADPTFEWLRQIIFEPEDRVRIQELKPEEKEDYQIIDKVKFIDNNFYPGEILINQNLTTIIGWKSTGKSILLRNIAQAIDPREVWKRLQEVGLPPYLEEVADFRVIWRDWQENKKNEATPINKKIIYIPQSYLNRLVDKKEDKTSIDDIIKDVLEQEDDVKSVFKKLESRNREIEKAIAQSIEELFYAENDIHWISESIKKIGDKKGIEAEINKLKIEISEFKKKAWMSDEEIVSYNELLEKITNAKREQEQIGKDLGILERLRKNSNLSKTSFFTSETLGHDSFEEFIFWLSPGVKNSLEGVFDEIKWLASQKWEAKIDAEYGNLTLLKTKNQEELAKLNADFSPLLEKAQKSKSLDEKIKKIEQEDRKLKEILRNEAILESLNKDYMSLIKCICENHSAFFDNYFNARTEILKQRTITEDQDLGFWIEVIFESIAFQEDWINDIFDQRKLGQFEPVSLQEYKFLNKTDFKNDIEKIILAILNGKINLKNSYSKKEAITRLVQSWFTFDYQITQNGDNLSKMSPGKKSFVLLKLLIELDGSKCPILLDQPEDDLDNRSIYYDLVKFIKSKKKERQIIIATHNPNLVVGADSENVIVANQNGDKSKNRTYRFEYFQWSLENTFLNKESEYTLEQRGIQEHVCDVLEGWKIAFEHRKQKYNFS